VQPLCDPSWAATPDGMAAKSGSKALSLSQTQDLMKTWIDERFQGNYDRLFGRAGWTPKAFLNYYAGPPDGKHTKMTEELIVSVHEFSQEPILVYHFGLTTPKAWTPKRFPRLVLFHAAPFPVGSGRSFNFNKMRAMLISRAKVGIQLDSDQFVAPGVDDMFVPTEREITKDYPMPILPAHFLDRTPRDLGAYWKRYCPADKCKWQTARWGHAHPTWTYWALPWLGRWLRMNFRDETLPAKEDGSMEALRVIDVPEDEDLLNVGTWEDGGNKQWCKLDIAGVEDFDALLKAQVLDRCSVACENVGGDRRFHKKGVAKVFYTAHHAVDVEQTKRYIASLKKKQADGSLPPPIMYGGRFYKNGDALRAAIPDLSCII